jgi:hypothetical protein
MPALRGSLYFFKGERISDFPHLIAHHSSTSSIPLMATFKELTDYFQRVGANDVKHSNKGYLAHAIGVFNDLKEWGWDEELAMTGLFHSIYGTELFQGFTLPLDRRDEIAGLIGKRAEFLSWLNCAIDRSFFDQQAQKDSGPYQIKDRFSGDLVDVSDEDFDALCFLHLCDWLEQVARSGAWDYRRTAYAALADRVGGIGKTRYEEVFADAPQRSWFEEYEFPADVPR